MSMKFLVYPLHFSKNLKLYFYIFFPTLASCHPFSLTCCHCSSFTFPIFQLPPSVFFTTHAILFPNHIFAKFLFPIQHCVATPIPQFQCLYFHSQILFWKHTVKSNWHGKTQACVNCYTKTDMVFSRRWEGE